MISHDTVICGIALPNAITFLHWLCNHPKVLAERAKILEYQQELLWVDDIGQRGNILQNLRVVLDKIDDQLSKQIIQKRQNR